MARDGIIRGQAHLPAEPFVAVDQRAGPWSPPADGAGERAIQFVSRWAGICAFVGAMIGIGVLLF